MQNTDKNSLPETNKINKHRKNKQFYKYQIKYLSEQINMLHGVIEEICVRQNIQTQMLLDWAKQTQKIHETLINIDNDFNFSKIQKYITFTNISDAFDKSFKQAEKNMENINNHSLQRQVRTEQQMKNIETKLGNNFLLNNTSNEEDFSLIIIPENNECH